MPIRILLVEDSDIDTELLTAHLTRAELDVEIDRVYARKPFLTALDQGGIDVILADFSLPDFDGLSALTLARERAPDVPFIFVSGIVGEEFATNALKRGATDYVLKRNLSRVPTAIERALAETNQRMERRRAEDEVRQLNATLEAQVEARTRERDRIWKLSRDMFAVADAEARLRAVNPAWTAVLGVTADRVLGRPLTEFVHIEDVAATEQALAMLRDGAPSARFEGRLRDVEGGWRWVAWTAVAEADAFYAVGRDITEEKAAAAALAAVNRDLTEQITERERVEATLRQLQRLEAVGQLTSGVAHDFNNLLTVILGNIDFVERGMAELGIDGKMKARIGNMRTAAERGAKLTAQLLAFSRRQRLEPKSVDLNETVASMRELLQSTMGGSVRLETVLKADLWPALVDPTQIEMIILNLAINARDAMEVGGGLTVETTNATLTEPPSRPEEPTPGDYVALIVSDTGSGMSEEVVAKAFEPFFTTKEVGKGSGLGLAQVFGFAKQSGGGVRIETRLGEGTSVKVYLPRATGLSGETGETARGLAPSAASANIKVLVVDDDSAVREVTASMLKDLGYQVTEAGSGRSGVEKIKDGDFDILLVDYAMPGMNGVETAAAAQKAKPGLPVLFITGYADLAALKEVGEERIVSKPYRDNELARKLEAVLRNAGVGRPSADVIPMARRS